MATGLSRRDLISRTIGLGVASALPFAATPLRFARAASAPIKLNHASLLTGFSVIIGEYMQAKRFDLKHGLDIAIVNTYGSVANYYTDFAAGTFDLAIGSWDTFAAMFHRGVPVKMACSVTTANLVNLLVTDPKITGVPQLAKASIAAVQSAGSYKMTAALIAEIYKLKLGEDIKVQNVPSPAQSITLLMAGNAEGALSWEPDVSIGMSKVPDMRPIFNLGEAYQAQQKTPLPYFGFALRADALKQNPDVAQRVVAAYSDCITAILANVAEAVDLAAPKMKIAPTVLKTAFESGRLKLDFMALTEPSGRAVMEKAAQFMKSRGALSDDVSSDFFA